MESRGKLGLKKKEKKKKKKEEEDEEEIMHNFAQVHEMMSL